MSETIPIQTIQFSISTQFSSIWPIDRVLSSAATLGQREPGSNGNEGVLHIPQSSSITETSPSDCLVSYPGHSLVESYCRDVFSVFYSPSRLGKKDKRKVCIWEWLSWVYNESFCMNHIKIVDIKSNFGIPNKITDIIKIEVVYSCGMQIN